MAKKKIKPGIIVSKTPVTDSFDAVMEQARVQIFDRSEKPSIFYHRKEIATDSVGEMLQGKFVIYRATAESPILISYECICGNTESAEVEFEGPRTIPCSACEKLVYLQEKAPKAKKPKKAKD